MWTFTVSVFDPSFVDARCLKNVTATWGKINVKSTQIIAFLLQLKVFIHLFIFIMKGKKN